MKNRDRVLEFEGPQKTMLLVPAADDLGGQLPMIYAVIASPLQASSAVADLFAALAYKPQAQANGILLLSRQTPIQITEKGREVALYNGKPTFNKLALMQRNVGLQLVDCSESELPEKAMGIAHKFIKDTRLLIAFTPSPVQ